MLAFIVYNAYRCYVMLCYVMLWYGMVWYGMLCYAYMGCFFLSLKII